MLCFSSLLHALLFWGKLYCYSSTESKLLRVQLINYLFFFLIRFLLQCLEDLDTSLRKLNSRLFVLRGQPTDLFPKIFKVQYPSCCFYRYCCWCCYSHKYVAVLSIILCASVIVTAAVVIATGCYFSCCFCRECYTSTVVAATIVVSVYFVVVALISSWCCWYCLFRCLCIYMLLLLFMISLFAVNFCHCLDIVPAIMYFCAVANWCLLLFY